MSVGSCRLLTDGALLLSTSLCKRRHWQRIPFVHSPAVRSVQFEERGGVPLPRFHMRQIGRENRGFRLVAPGPDQGDLRHDQCLIMGVHAGDVRAIEELYRRWHPWILRLARHETGRFQDAQDLAHEAFLSLFEQCRRAPLLLHSGLAPWLSQVIVHLAMRASRTASRTVPLEEQSPIVNPGDSEDITVRRDSVESILRRLGPDDRKLLRMHFEDDLTSEEIAGVTASRPSTTQWRISMILTRLRAKLHLHRTEEWHW